MESRPDPESRRRTPRRGRAQADRGAGALTTPDPNTRSALAPAKVNLFLHVGPVSADGYHPISSLVAFADVGDTVTVTHADRLSVTAIGPFAAGLGPGEDNLIHRALLELGHVAGVGEPSLAVTLDKTLPVAAGLGGGSSDAGAALKLARVAMGLDLADTELAGVSRVIGADGPMCLAARSAWAEGIGDRLSLVPELPPLHAVLANPGRPSSTGAVYRAYDAGPVRAADRPTPPTDWSPVAVIDWLAGQRNDLQGPAVALEPAIGEALSAMQDAGARLTRMSGSGATVFGLFETAETAQAAVDKLSRYQGDWWVRRTVLGGSAA